MEFRDLIRNRRSTRIFTGDGVEEAKVSRILEAACLAPSAGNLQAYDIYLVRDEAARDALVRAAYGQEFIAAASVVLVFCAFPERSEPRFGLRGRELYAIQDATIASTWAMLAVADEGLGTVWVGSFDPEETRQAIGAPEGRLPVAILPIGYAEEIPDAKSRRELSDLVHEVR